MLLIKRAIYQEDITLLNAYAHDNRTFVYKKENWENWRGVENPQLHLDISKPPSQELVKLVGQKFGVR